MKNRKKGGFKNIIAFFIGLVMLFGCFPMNVFAEADLTEDSAQLAEIKIIQTITEKELAAQNCNWTSASKCTVYVHVTDATVYSWINAVAALGTERSGKASSKYLHASACTLKSGGYYIQDGIVGKAGTGNYMFPAVNLTAAYSDGTALSDEEKKKITIDVRTGTNNTNCEILGIVFNNGAVYPNGFKAPVCEDTALDKTEAGERENLKLTLDYCEKMASSKYTSASWSAFQTALAEATQKYNDEALSAEGYAEARAKLEAVKAKLVFVNSQEAGSPRPFRALKASEMTYEMGAGWNLGNTMDGHTGFTPAETAWQPYITTKKMIKAVHDMGINTVRIPVTWGTMINDDYTINEKWISRVQDIVDYCVSLDMYAIVNIHHDGAEQSGWLLVAADDIDSVYEKFECVWRNIAERFKDYDEHLIFESMNEVTSGSNATSDVLFDTPIIMNLNQIFVNVVRSTGSNNAKRWLSVPGHYALTSGVTDTKYGFDIPSDLINDRLFVAAHIYAGPSGFYMGENMSSTVCNLSDCSDMISKIKKLGTTWSDKGVPVIVGEFGCINKNNPTERAYYVEIFNRACKNAGMLVPCYWDQGWFDRTKTPADYSFSIIDREKCAPIDKEVTDGLIRGIYLSGDVSTLVKNPAITPITDIAVSQEEVKLELGSNALVTASVAPANTNDVVLWSSDDESIATVYRGKIRGRGVGVTKVKAFSQSGSFEKEITVTVTASAENAEIVTEKESYELAIGKSAYINAKINGSGFLSYTSSDDNVVTVSPIGKLNAIGEGTAFVTIMASNGTSKAIKVTVKSSLQTEGINLALNVYYNDSATKYYNNEVGESIYVTGNGQYTLSFDTDKDLSSTAKASGVKYLKNMTAIYIKDNDVTNGNATTTPLESCSITYNTIKVNGKELTITKPNPKSALKDSGIFDTNDPINGWDGSAVSEAEASNHVANFVGITEPKTIEVTFTLSDMKFKEADTGSFITAESIENVSEKDILISGEGSTRDIAVKVLPLTAENKVSFVSADSSIVAVNERSAEIDSATGIATVTLTAMSEGSTVVTAYVDDVSCAFNVTAMGDGDILYGDVDLNNEININDASAILNYVLNKDSSALKQIKAADTDKDGKITANDSSNVLQKALNSSFEFKR